jgi:predicted permease
VRPTPQAATQPIKRVVTLACAFGNSFTLPLVFLSDVLPAAQLDVAASYVALFLVGWSPALWSIGYHILNMGVKAPKSDKERSADGVPDESSTSERCTCSLCTH